MWFWPVTLNELILNPVLILKIVIIIDYMKWGFGVSSNIMNVCLVPVKITNQLSLSWCLECHSPYDTVEWIVIASISCRSVTNLWDWTEVSSGYDECTPRELSLFVLLVLWPVHPNHWRLHSSELTHLPVIQLLIYFPPQYALRSKALEGDLTKYSCCRKSSHPCWVLVLFLATVNRITIYHDHFRK